MTAHPSSVRSTEAAASSSPAHASTSPISAPAPVGTAPTTPLVAVLALTFFESVGTVLLERAVYFYTTDVLRLTETDNLWLAFAFGGFYAVGALASHRLAARTGEKRLLVGTLFCLLLLHTGLAFDPRALSLALAFPAVGFLQGAKWPLVETFMSAGRTPTELARTLGRYNATWSIAVPLALGGSGPLIASRNPFSLFISAAALNVVALFATLPFTSRPRHLDEAHPERPQEADNRRMASLVTSARWCMLLSYALLFLLAPLMPEVLARLDIEVSLATPIAAILDVARIIAFTTLGLWTGWRGRASHLGVAVVTLPIGFAMVLFGKALATVIAGELLFGLASGLAYTAALYYALVLKNASVDAGGAHEGLIGAGFALGPVAGLVAHATAPSLGGYTPAMVTSVVPLIAAGTFFALRPLRAALR